MSIDQPSLESSIGRKVEQRRQARRERLQETGSVYGGVGGDDVATDAGAPENTCLHCGTVIDSDVGRVLGDEHGNVEACRRCARDRHGDRIKTTSVVVCRFVRGDSTLTFAEEWE